MLKLFSYPQNTASTLQPMEQGVIATFKAYYPKGTFKQAIDSSTRENLIFITEFWKTFNLKDD